MRHKKTVNVQEIKDELNSILANSDASLVDFREGILTSLESILLRSNNYQGFKYLSAREVSDGKPGIREDNNFYDTDPTRRRYF